MHLLVDYVPLQVSKICDIDQLFALAAFKVRWLTWICSHSHVYPAIRLLIQYIIAQADEHRKSYVIEVVVV